jgi:hypothetical protein
VLPDSPHEIVGNAGVQSLRAVTHNVDKEGTLAG